NCTSGTSAAVLPGEATQASITPAATLLSNSFSGPRVALPDTRTRTSSFVSGPEFSASQSRPYCAATRGGLLKGSSLPMRKVTVDCATPAQTMSEPVNAAMAVRRILVALIMSVSLMFEYGMTASSCGGHSTHEFRY